jgi:DNA processing protein
VNEAGACDKCLARTWLLARLAGHLDRHRDRIDALLELDAPELIAALAGRQRPTVERELESFDPPQARRRATDAGLELICRCHSSYPRTLAQLSSAPAVLHVAGSLDRFLALAGRSPVAIVGARRASPYGLDVAWTLARRLAVAGVPVLSGMAVGIDSAAHRGALHSDAPTIAVLGGPAERPYPARARALHRRIQTCGAVVSELAPGTATRRWMFPARNRLIAALSALTVVVEARPGSGALITAGYARELSRPVGAVPGLVTSPLAAGPHELIRSGARLIDGPEAALDALFGVGAAFQPPARPRLAPELEALLDALAEGQPPTAALARAGLDVDVGLAALASLELAGRVRHEPGGRYSVLP